VEKENQDAMAKKVYLNVLKISTGNYKKNGIKK